MQVKTDWRQPRLSSPWECGFTLSKTWTQVVGGTRLSVFSPATLALEGAFSGCYQEFRKFPACPEASGVLHLDHVAAMAAL